MYGVITLVSSKNPAVFGENPILVEYDGEPEVGKSFEFYSRTFGNCWTSVIQSIIVDSERPIKLLTTLNSVYQLQDIFGV